MKKKALLIAAGKGLSSMLAVRRRSRPRQANATSKRQKAADRRAARTAADNKPTVVLLVDDDPSFLPAMARLLRSAGFKVSTFDRASAVLASDIPRANACMVVDVHMPEMNGIELCEQLAESGRGLPTIMITGRNDAETRRLVEQAHPVALLLKPVEEKVLLEAIDRALALLKDSRSDD